MAIIVLVGGGGGGSYNSVHMNTMFKICFFLFYLIIHNKLSK